MLSDTNRRAAISGIVRYVEKPKDAVAIVREPDLSDVIVLSVGGAVTFVGTGLMKRPAALLTIEGAPGLREEHYPVFDCASPCGRACGT